MSNKFAEQTETAEETSTEFTEEVTEEVAAEEQPVDYTDAEEAPADGEPEGEFEKKDDDKDDSEDSNDDDSSEDKDDEEEKKPASEHSLEEYEALQEELEALRAECEQLREFKLAVVNEQKDALINSYYMLSDEDKREVIEHKSEYSLDEIKSKLAVIYVEKNVDFTTLDGQPEVSEVAESEEEDPITTFSLDDEPAGFVSPLQEALRRTLFE